MTRTASSQQRDGRSWYRIHAQADGPALVYLHDEIGWFGITAQDFLRDLAAVNGPVEVHINSGGGDVFDAYAIYNGLLARAGVTTVVDGLAASSASVIAMAGEQRLAARTSQIMVHDAWAGADGNAAAMTRLAARLETVSGQIADVYAGTAGGTADYWRGLMQDETWFTAQQALDAGLLTGILDSPREPAPAGAGASAAARSGAILAAGIAAAWDPDGDGDDDSTPDGDTDNSHWAADGTQKKSVPGKPMPGQPPAEEPTPNNAAGPAASAAAAVTPSASKGRTVMANDDGTLTIEGRRSRVTEIEGRCREIMASYPASVYPADVQTEWDRLVIESREHIQALEAVDRRNADLAQMYVTTPGTHDRTQDPQGGNGNGTPQGQPQRYGGGTPAVHIRHDIYDLVAIQQQARNRDELPGLYRDNALRAIEQHRFPGSDRETSQANVAKLLETIPDDTTGMLARRILATGSPEYARVFGRALAAGRPPTTGRDAEILALGESDTGSFAVPFQLDPTIILTTNGAINPLRQISRVEQITGKEFDLVTSTGVVVSRKAEFAAETDNSPVLAQPTLQPKRVSGWIPFSVELEGDWSGLQASMMALLSDAKDVEESGSFTNGPGTGVTAGGVVALQTGGSLVTGTGGVSTLSFKDPETLESAMAPRFRAQASYLASKTTYNKYRNLFAGQTGFATDPWNRPTLGQPRELWGYPAYENSDMVITNVTGDKVLLMGDFGHGFLIVDRVGMQMELVPTVFGAAQGQFPTGRRGYYCWWRNNSTVLIPNAFRLLVVG